ncbi:MAG: aldehyde dehydrogenase [Desulfobacterales bacterium]|nr:aldehyde dehydrogenase [Desulfobacterales bacterium]
MPNIKDTIVSQRNFFSTHQTKDIEVRIQNLEALRHAIHLYEEKLYEALFKDLHKSAFESYATEIGIVLNEITYHINNLKNWLMEKKVSTPLIQLLSWSYIVPEPYGVVLIMAPWNYPFQLLMMPLIGAISAGNCVVLKPGELSRHTAAVIADMIGETFDSQYISIFSGGKETNQELLNEKFDFIFFTGSSGLGRLVMMEAAKHLTPVCLELGGKSPCIVDLDANLDLASKRVAWGKYLNAGQTCVAPDYLMVHDSVKDTLLHKIKACIQKFYSENPKETPDYCRIINEVHFNRLIRLMESGQIIFGGENDSKDFYISPTIIDHVPPDSPIMQEEIFGPILPIMTFYELYEAIQFVNDHPKPLALYYFSSDEAKQKEIIKKTSSGGVVINDTIVHLINPNLPFGGVGNSGIGSYHGKYSFDIFSHHKSILKKSTLVDLPIRYAPFKNKLSFIKRLMK